MTKLFNLESYIDCCQYAMIFKDSTIPESRKSYKSLLDKYADKYYLSSPIFNDNLVSQLTINPTKLNYLSVGTELSHGEKKRLFIISDRLDLMTLSMSNLIERHDSYLYSSAYHYWNHYQEIHQHGIPEKLVFVDLDNFDISTLIPVSFSQPENSHYLIPVLDTRNPISLNQVYNGIQTYQNICAKFARILLRKFPSFSENSQTVNHLSSYLKKINFLDYIQPYINQESINLIIEIYHNEQIFYKQVNASISEIANTVYQQLDFGSLNKLANNYPEYKFVLISKYNIFPRIATNLPKFLCLQSSHQQFQQIWTEKNNLHFPLFAIYLDDIEFEVFISNHEEWIQLSPEGNTISYEGETILLTGIIPDLNQNYFRIPQGNSSASLPIKVNGDDYCINDVPQDYKIQIENYQGTEEILVQIQFNLQPGSFPELKVRDLENKYRINTSLIDKQELYYSNIRPRQITRKRQQQSLSQIENLRITHSSPRFMTDLNLIHPQLNIDSIGYDSLMRNIRNANQRIANLLIFIDTSSSEAIVKEIITILENNQFHRLVNIVNNLLINNHTLNRQKKDFLVEVFIFIGRLYQFSQYLRPDKLFSNIEFQFNIINQITYRNLSNEYIQCLARIAINQEFQEKYFSLFNSNYSLENSQYLWGYSRILLWYYNFNLSSSILDYRQHFIQILNYLLTKSYRNFEIRYRQNAFLSLIYLLTFRSHHSGFCKLDSEEFSLANRVNHNFQDDRIILKAVSKEKPLNHYFKEMIESCSTEEGIRNLLQA